MPVPVPAVVNLAEAHGLPLRLAGLQGERITPTGAAIAATVMTTKTLPQPFTILKTGVGAGKRAYTDAANLLRLFLIEPEGGARPFDSASDAQNVVQLEANLDDSTGEILGRIVTKLISAGALDATVTPVVMKKNRPGAVLTVLCRRADQLALEALIFAETTTIGIRSFPVSRSVLPRTIETVDTPWGPAKVKVTTRGSRRRGVPEFDTVDQLAQAAGVPFPDAYAAVLSAWQAQS